MAFNDGDMSPPRSLPWELTQVAFIFLFVFLWFFVHLFVWFEFR